MLAATVAASAASGAGTALATPVPLVSESFESGVGLPVGWQFVEYRTGISSAAVVAGRAADGAHFLRISSPTPNHARVLVPVTLAPSTTYRFHALARANVTGPGAAAVLGIDGQYTVTDSVRTDDRWQDLDLYVRPGLGAPVELSLGLGHFGQLNAGVADFDSVTVEPVDAVPAGAVVAGPDPADTATPVPQAAADVALSTGPSPLLWLFVGILAAVGGAVVVVLRREQPQEAGDGGG